MEQTLKVKIFGDTDKGRVRPHNEDNFIINEDVSHHGWSFGSNQQFIVNTMGTLLVVADGMGGTAAGEVASKICIDSIRTQFDNLNSLPAGDTDIIQFLKTCIYNAHSEIVETARQNPQHEGMGTTVNIGLIYQRKLYVAWSGDSRIYRYSKKGIRPSNSYDSYHMEILTPDHSEVWKDVEKGKLTSEQARVHAYSNFITQSLGDVSDPPKPDGRVISLAKGDRIVACSDGLNSMLPDFQIEDILAQEENTEQACLTLIENANKAGGEDNVTVVVADIIDGPEPSTNANLVTGGEGLNQETVTKKIGSSEGKQKVKWFLKGLILLGFLFALGILYKVFSNQLGEDKKEAAALTFKAAYTQKVANLRDELAELNTLADANLFESRTNSLLQQCSGFVESMNQETELALFLKDTANKKNQFIFLKKDIEGLSETIYAFTNSKPEDLGKRSPKPRVDKPQSEIEKTALVSSQRVSKLIDTISVRSTKQEQIEATRKQLAVTITNLQTTKKDIETLRLFNDDQTFNKEEKLRIINQYLGFAKDYQKPFNLSEVEWHDNLQKGIEIWERERTLIQQKIDQYKFNNSVTPKDQIEKVSKVDSSTKKLDDLLKETKIDSAKIGPEPKITDNKETKDSKKEAPPNDKQSKKKTKKQKRKDRKNNNKQGK